MSPLPAAALALAVLGVPAAAPAQSAAPLPRQQERPAEAGPLTLETVIAGIASGAATGTGLERVGEDAEVHTVMLSQLGGGQGGALDAALGKSAGRLAAMREAIDRNATLSSELREDGFGPQDVVALHWHGKRRLSLVIDDRGRS